MSRSEITFTADDYRALPDDAPRMELLDGEFVMTPAPTTRHQILVGRLFHLIATFFDGNPLGRVFVAPCDVYLGGKDVSQPDVFVILAGHSDRIQADGIHGPPDLVIEVTSPSSGVQDLTLKREIYRRAGVPEYWIVDPSTSAISVYRLLESEARLHFDVGTSLKTPTLPGFEPAIAAVFAP